MKKTIACILLLFSINGFCQAPDSLWNVWQNESNHDTVRLEALKDFIQGDEFQLSGFISFNPDSTLILVEEMHQMALAKGYREYELWAVRLKGGYYQLIKQDLAQGVKYFEEALVIAHEIDEDQLILMSMITLANATILLDENKSEEFFRKALSRIELENLKSSELTSRYDAKSVYYAGQALNGFGSLRYEQQDYDDAIKYFQDAIRIGVLHGNQTILEGAMVRIGWAFIANRMYVEGINYYSQSLKMAEDNNDHHWEGHILQSIGDLYVQIGDYRKGQEYLTQALEAMKGARGLYNQETSIILYSIASSLHEQKLYQESLESFLYNLEVADSVSKTSFITPYILGAIADNYRFLGDYTKGYEYAMKALEISNDESLKLQLNIIIGNNYRMQRDYRNAISFCEKALAFPDYEVQQYACECLYESYKSLGNGNEALVYHEKYSALTDSLHKDEIAKNLMQMEFNEQMLEDSLAKVEEARLIEEAHQEEIRKEQSRRNAFMMGGFGVLIIAGGLWSRLRYIRKSKAELQTEKDRSENLLLNILPGEIAEELKTKGKADARDFENVSILFTDFKEFTQTSEKLTAQQLVKEINICFEAFDDTCAKYEIEKIKTIGDAYMAAGGLPVPTSDSTKNTVLAALEMQQFIKQRKEANSAEGKPAFEMRVGIHTGPVVAGIVGVKKFQYDIWGDTVNTASRMESSGDVGKVNISQDTFELISDELDLDFTKRGKMEVKGKGEMDMYFVDFKGTKSE